MTKRMIGLFGGEVIPCRILDIRQGLEPLPRFDVASSASYVNGASTYALSPDQSYMVQGIQTSSGNMFVFGNPEDLLSRTAPSVSFAGIIYTAAASNTHYAFGGSSPYLYVFNRATGALQTVSTTGLGTVYALDFSPDGKFLAVAHSTSPYVRIYKTNDWTFVNASIASGVNNYACTFSHDSSKLVVFAYSSPYISVYDAATGVRSYSNTNESFIAGVNSSGGPRSVRSPMDSKTIIFALQITPFIASFDTSTNTPALFATPSPAILVGSGHLFVDPDPEEDAVYLVHAPGSTSPSRQLSKFKISTGTIYPDQSPIYRNLLWGNVSWYITAYIISTNKHKMTGTVRDLSNNPAARKVRAYRRTNGELVAQTTSNASTGNYVLRLPDAGPFDLQFLTEDGELLNDLFFARSEPEAV